MFCQKAFRLFCCHEDSPHQAALRVEIFMLSGYGPVFLQIWSRSEQCTFFKCSNKSQDKCCWLPNRDLCGREETDVQRLHRHIQTNQRLIDSVEDHNKQTSADFSNLQQILGSFLLTIHSKYFIKSLYAGNYVKMVCSGSEMSKTVHEHVRCWSRENCWGES